jgi:hypothetical protein
MRAASTIFVLCLFAAPALAATASAPPPADKEGAPGTNVEMPFLMAPLTGADGKLSGYAYISTKLTAVSGAGALDVRDRIAFIQDAFVRDLNGTGIGKDGDPSHLDHSALEARLLADARKVMGAGKVASITVVQLQVAPLHPDPAMTPKAALPEDDAPPAKAKPAKAP